MSTWQSEMTPEEWGSIVGVPLPEQEYIDKLGYICPSCSSCSVDSEDRIEADYGIAWQNVFCTICHAQWQDNYNLVGYSNLEIPDNDSSK